MSKLRKTIEFYKTLHPQAGYQIKPVRGLYVSGEWLKAWYIDHVVTLTQWDSTGTIADYTVSEKNVEDHNINILGFEFGDFSLVNYTTSEKDFEPDHNINIVEFGFSDPVLVNFTTIEHDLDDDHNINIVEFEFDGSTVVLYEDLPHYTNNEPLITLQNFTSNGPTITDDH
jgi:hypothetical protein